MLKSFWQNLTPFYVLGRSGIQETYLNIIKAIYSKSIPNIKLDWEKLKANSLNKETRQGCPLSKCLLNIVLQVLTRTIRQQRRSGVQTVQEEVKACMIAYSKWSPRFHQRWMPSAKWLDTRPTEKRKAVAFLYIWQRDWERNQGSNTLHNSHKFKM